MRIKQRHRVWWLLCAALLFSESATAQTAVDFEKDISFAQGKLMELHPKLTCDAEEQRVVQEAFAALRTKSKSLSVPQFNLELSKVFALLHDGHTRVDLGNEQQWMPFRLYLFEDGLYVTAIEKSKEQFIGAKVERIGNLTWKEAMERVQPLICADNNWWVMEQGPCVLSCVEVLHFVTATTGNKVDLVVEKEGKRATLSFEGRNGGYTHTRWMQWGEMFGPFEELAAYRPGLVSFDFRANKPELPVHMRLRQPYHFNLLPTSGTLLFQFNFVEREWDGTTSRQFFDSLFTFADAHKNEIRRFVLDIRYNSGGDGSKLKPFVLHLLQRPWLQEDGEMFVIIGRKTFSSGVMLYSELKKYANAVFVGEPAGSGVNLFGDAAELELPDSKIPVHISTLFWQTGVSSDTSRAFAPDVPLRYDASTYFSGEDVAMTEIEKGYTKLTDFVRRNGAEEVQQTYAAYKTRFGTEVSWWRPFAESEMNTAGYDLLGVGKVHEAITAFELNTLEYPNSWNPWDSLGEAYAANGESEKAIAAYTRSLSLNPNNSSAIQFLKETHK